MLKSLSELEAVFTEQPPNHQPQYCLFLEGINEISVYAFDDAENEINRILLRWKNVRFLISGRSPNAFHSIDCRIQMTGVPDSIIIEQTGQSRNKSIFDFLKSPFFLNIYNALDFKNATSRAELLDAYFDHVICDSNQIAVRFLVKCILPYAAFEMAHNWHSAIERADFAEIVRKAISFYFEDDRIFQNYTILQNIRKESSLTKSDFITFETSAFNG